MLALLYTFLTGEYLGFATTGFEEDSPVVVAILAAHSAS